MARGYKSGGRRAGTPNKRTQELSERLEELGCDPVDGLARIAQDESASLELRARCYSDLMQYVYPRRRAVEGSLYGEEEGVIFNISYTMKNDPDTLEPPATPPVLLPDRTFGR